jgi:hypothetical protein
VHRRPGVLHSLRHVFRNFRSAVQPERRHSELCFRDLGGNVRVTHAELGLNLLQGLEMIAHVGERVLDHGRRKLDKLPGVWSARGGRIMAVLVLGDSECCAATS